VNPTTLTVIQKAVLERDDMTAAEYNNLRDFLSKIVKAQAKYVAYQ
jgi:uncharacterized protein YfkK (UPF0435 family)